MQGLTRSLLRNKLTPAFVLSPPPSSTVSRPLSVLASGNWRYYDRCQFFLPGPSATRRVGLQDQQVRFRRHDRASAFTKPRPKNKKQRKEYNRKLKRLQEEQAKHNPPGSRAGPRRQFVRERWQHLLDLASSKDGNNKLVPSGVEHDEDREYGVGDALMEDLLGNTSHLTSQPTPEPVYLGHMHKKYYNIVADQMDRYREAIDLQARAQSSNESPSGSSTSQDARASALLDLSTGAAALPSDKSISQVLRAYRDRHGTRNRPIGISMALEHVLKDLGVPIVAFGEYTYTTLLTCCRTPIEARRIMKLMTDQQHPISAYSWSILVDIHAKLGDFEGCARVIKEMAFEGTPPTQAAYTSLLAACYKVCNDGRIPHPIRAKAGEIGWTHWQEMRIVGINADAMAYGAIIRLCAARGQPERAINLLEEMDRFQVKPTTLCFSGALRAVARSHEISIRFERGSSRKMLRRESFAAHHGKMARQIVIMAENAEVEQDEGFVSALMLCAAAAGDSATAKAVFLAAEVRKMDHLRTIGPDSSLKLLRQDSSATPLRDHVHETEDKSLEKGLTQQEHDRIDGQAHGVKTPPSTPHQQSRLPQVQNETEYAVKSFGEREYGADTRVLSALLRSCGQALHKNGLGTMWAGQSNQGYLDENSLRLITTRREPIYTEKSIPDELSSKVGISSLRRYDEHDRDEPRKKGAARQKFRGLYLDDDAVELINEYADVYDASRNDDEVDEFLEQNASHRDNVVGTKNVPSSGMNHPSNTLNAHDNESGSEEASEKVQSLDSFDIFFKELKEEAKDHGLTEELSEDDARELFEMLKYEFREDAETDYYAQGESGASHEMLEEDEFSIWDDDTDENEDSDGDEDKITTSKQNTGDMTSTKGKEMQGLNVDSVVEGRNMVVSKTDLDQSDVRIAPVGMKAVSAYRLADSDGMSVLSELEGVELERIEDLMAALPGMPISRIKKLAKAFEKTLGYPSLLTLVPIVRETLPDHLTLGHLKKINRRNADFVLQRAEEDGLVDQSLLNAMLQVKTSASSLDEAENFHRDEFRRHNLKPTAYSDRLVLQMIVENHRLPRALDFKRKIESEKRILDLPSYGTLIDYYGRHNQLGSAISLLKECVVTHGSPPSEIYLSSTRLLAQQSGMHDELGLSQLLGEDPTLWLKHGERHLKRERTYRGRRDVKWVYNRILG